MDIDPALVAHTKLAIATLCGGVVRLLFRPAASLAKTAWLLFGCVTCGFYGTPVALHLFGLSAVDWAGSMGALIGFVGLSLAEGLLRAADRFDVAAWFGRKVS